VVEGEKDDKFKAEVEKLQIPSKIKEEIYYLALIYLVKGL